MPRVSATEREATRTRLIEAAKREFADRGLAGARFDEISLAAGHAKGTIYNYFDSKEALFFTIVEEWCSLLSAAVDPLDAGSAREELLRIAELDVEIARKDPDLARVVVQQMPALTGSHADAVNAAIASGLALAEAAFERGLRLGEFSSELPASSLARLFLATLSGFELEALVPDATIDLDDVVGLVDVHFITGMRTP